MQQNAQGSSADGFTVGAKVKHRICGSGTIKDISGDTLTIALDSGAEKKLSLSSVLQANALKLL